MIKYLPGVDKAIAVHDVASTCLIHDLLFLPISTIESRVS